ncbi:MAG: 6-bladed beta-propeller [Balneolaceae bacterium]|jgi:hypothetical protein|nr:MAG: 6-bladed beta-propeller [Balneolaceae bacterium]
MIRIQYRNIFILYLTGLLLFSCSTKESWEIEAQTTIDQLILDVQVFEIDADAIPAVELEPDFIITSDKTEGFDFGLPVDIITLNDSIYVLDQAQNCVFALDQKGIIHRQVSRAGRGPGEFSMPASMVTNGEFVFISDTGNSRIHKFSHAFEILKTIDASTGFSNRNLSSSDSLLYTYDGSIIRNESKYIIRKYRIGSQLEEIDVLVPRLLSMGKQPFVLNEPEFYSNSAGYFIMGYAPVPRLFLYGPEGDLQLSIHLSGSVVDKINEFQEENKHRHRTGQSQTLGLAPFIYSVALDNDMNIYLFTVYRNLIVLSKNNGDYHLAGNYTLEHPDGYGRKGKLSLFGENLALMFNNYTDILVYNLKNFN